MIDSAKLEATLMLFIHAMPKTIFQTMSINDCQLQNNRIDIWQFSLATIPTGMSILLTEDEQIRAQRFYFAKHQRRFTVARAMLRLILATYLNEKPNHLNFSYNQYGKPSLKYSDGIEFNLSHSADLALLAVGQKFPLGIDLEFFSTRPYDDIGKNLFSAQEIEGLSRQDNYMKQLSFFHIWTQKEALIKANGMGLSYPTQQFTVPISPSIDILDTLIYDSLHAKFWKTISFMPDTECSAALCYDPIITVLRKIIIHPEYFL